MKKLIVNTKTNNKKGFTLVELLAAIAIISILAIFVVPNIIKLFNNSVDSAMETQEKQVFDGAVLYVTDYCKRPISGKVCSSNYVNDSFVCLSDIQASGYIDSVLYRGSTCKGVIIFENGSYYKGNTYLYCGSSTNYAYKTKGENSKVTNNMKSACGI